jgi:hypothetical protein
MALCPSIVPLVVVSAWLLQSLQSVGHGSDAAVQSLHSWLVVVPPALICRSCNRQLLRWESVRGVGASAADPAVVAMVEVVGSVVAVPAICRP